MMHLLLDLSLRAGLLALATAVVLVAGRIRTATGRHRAWTIVLIGMLLLPVWGVWGPEIPIPLPARPSEMHVPVSWVPGTVEAVTPARPMQPVAADRAAQRRESSPPPVPWDTWGLALYGIGAGILLWRLALGTVRTRRLMQQAIPAEGYLTSSACSAPITVGWLRPVVLLPPGYQRWPARQLDAVLIHEHEHARRRDPLVQWLSLLNRALFWFHPFAWWLDRHLATLAEEACDTAVLSRGHSPGEYAEYLLDVARSVGVSGGRVQAVGTALPGTSLPARIRQILRGGSYRRDSYPRLTLALVLCCVSSVAIGGGTLTPMRPPTSQLAQNTPRQSPSRGQTLAEFWLDDDEWHREVAPIITAAEAAGYGRLQTVAARDSFIAEFWRRRDTSPDTPENEFRKEFERRIAYARENLANPSSYAVPGYETDRGRFYVAWGPPAAVSTSSQIEQWRYGFVPAMGTAVTLEFDPSADFGCSVRGGRYRIISPPPRARFEGAVSGSTAGPVALTYPGGFVYLAFPIDAGAASIRFGMRSRSGAETNVGEVRGPIDYIQGAVLETRRGGVLEPILALVDGSARLFEPDSYACTEQLPADTYTLSVETTLVNGTRRTRQVTFQIE